MDWIEASPMPEDCRNCKESDCYNCDHLGKRWQLPERDRLLLRRKLMEHAVARYQRKIAEIDRQFSMIE